MEKSSVDEVDANKWRQGAFEHVSGALSGGRQSPGPGATTVVQGRALDLAAKSSALRVASTWAGRCDRPECPRGGERDERALARTCRMGDRAANIDTTTLQFRLWEMLETDATRIRYVVYPGRAMMD
eukprot:7611315-Pyramimonas_sp.AAC.1